MCLKDIAVVTRNYNNYAITIQCILDVKNSSKSDIGQIIIVDDCSTDNSVIELRKALPDVCVIEMPKFSEYCVCFNIGVNEAIEKGANYIQIVNNDTKNFTPSFLNEMKSKFKDRPQIGIVGSLVYDYEKNIRTSSGGFHRYGIFVDIPTEGYMLSRKAIQKVGLFDPKLVRHLEDYDLLIRLRKAGFWSVTCDSASFDHLGGGTSKKMMWVPNYYRMRNIVWFLKRHGYDYKLSEKLRIIYGFSNKSRKLAGIDFKKKKFLRGNVIIFAAFCGTIIGFFRKW